MKSPSLSPRSDTQALIWSPPLPSATLWSLIQRAETLRGQNLGGGGGEPRVMGKEWGAASIFHQMALSVCLKSLCTPLWSFSSTSPLLLPSLKSSSSRTGIPASPLLSSRLSSPLVSMGEEVVVIITLVIPDSRAARDYTSDPLSAEL